MEKLLVECGVWIATSPERVWQALTDPEQIVAWFVPNLLGAIMKRDDTGKITVYLGEMGVEFMQLDMTDEPHKLTVHSLPDQLLRVIYSLEDQNKGTQVTVTMTGFEWLPEDTREDRVELTSRGWEKTLNNLRAYIAGAELPFPKAFVGPLFGFWREPQKKLAIERSIWINAPRERVWNAITDPKQIQQWYSPNTEWHLSALETGGRYYVQDTDSNAEKYVEIIERLDSPSQLVTRAVPEPPDTIIKNKTYTLRDENQGTRLILTLTGYEPELDDSQWDQLEQNTFGFGMLLQNTKAYIEGKSLPFPWGF